MPQTVGTHAASGAYSILHGLSPGNALAIPVWTGSATRDLPQPHIITSLFLVLSASQVANGTPLPPGRFGKTGLNCGGTPLHSHLVSVIGE